MPFSLPPVSLQPVLALTAMVLSGLLAWPAYGEIAAGLSYSISSGSDTSGRADGAAVTSRAGWSWPLRPRPEVLESFKQPAQPWLPGHRGVDLAGAPGSTIRSPANGLVIFSGWVVNRGVITVEHQDGLLSSFEPVAAAVPAGTSVREGERIADIGISEFGHCSPRSCLHWGVRDNGDYRDPLGLLGELRRSVLLPLAAPTSSHPPLRRSRRFP